MKIGVISDSHDHQRHITRAVDMFNQQNVECVFHCGDIVSPFAVKPFAELKCPLIAVYGNNDGEINGLKNAVCSLPQKGEIHAPCYKGTHAGKKIFMTHMPNYIEDIAASQQYDLVLYGHTHKIDIRTVGKTLLFNPGESIGWLTGNANIAVINLDTMQYEQIDLD